MKSEGQLEARLSAGQFVVTAELGPPRGANVAVVREKAAFLKGAVDAVNVTDNQTAMVRLSSLATCVLVREAGLEPNLQMVCRDRNRLAMQADLLGAAALGIPNVVCLSGDHQSFGDHPGAKGVFDLDSMQLVALVRQMRDEGKFLSGQPIDGAPRLFIGAAANPFAEPEAFRVQRLQKKVVAGADFIQTQCIYNMPRFRRWLDRARDLGLTEKTFILAGLTPLKSLPMAQYMKQNVPGMDVPDELIRRLDGVPQKERPAEGIRIACEQIAELREMKGVAGIHLMAIAWEQKVPEILERAGLLPRPQLPAPAAAPVAG